ncbi:MAG: hypothetical protein ACLGI6_05910, partial [Gammaproteobacteria bacterium]
MGLFSIFKKKNEDTDANAPNTRLRAGESTRMRSGESTRMRMGESSRLMTEAERARQREIARETAAKIDAIESAMAQDIFNTPEPAWGSGPRRPRTNTQLFNEEAATLPLLELATTELMGEDELPVAPALAQTAPVIEEIAILYANGQAEIAEFMLKDSLAEVGQTARTVWWLLVDLYQIGGRHDDFDNVAIDYASQFETSPPAWSVAPTGGEQNSFAGVTPTVTFTGILDAGCAPQVQRLLQLAEDSPVLRVEFSHLPAVMPEGCALLKDALVTLRRRERELIVAGAGELAEQLRSSIEIGRREASEAPWLLLLELLQLMNREKDFEEIAMDYCITYEVSPPSFVAPHKVATASRTHAPVANERFMLPPLVEGDPTNLLSSIDAYVAQASVVLLDCSRLTRIDYTCANALLNRLRPVAAEKKIELRDVNHL